MTRTLLALLLLAAPAAADIPAAPVMTVYRFNGPTGIPYYAADRFARSGPSAPAGTLAQGTSVIPCLVMRNGRPLTDRSGTPFVGFDVVVDARSATRDSSAHFRAIAARQQAARVDNHHCPPNPPYVIDVRSMYALGKAPSYDPPRPPDLGAAGGDSQVDQIVRAFHASPQCEQANLLLMGRRDALRRAWDDFERDSRWPAAATQRARNLDYVMRTALYEGHLGRGCNAYGACERTVIALSIRNRGVERCQRGQGCRSRGDFEGVSSSVSQYNIWDEFLTQTSGLTSCFLRPDLAGNPHYARLQAMYGQNVGDVERILFGDAADLRAVFPGGAPAQLSQLRHYYHPPAMGKCFPGHPRLEYISGATARHGTDFALIANTRIEVEQARDGGYLFQMASIQEEDDGDRVQLADRYPGFVIDGRKVELKRAGGCTPYGTPRSCWFERVGRHRKVPSWLSDGVPLRLTCRVDSRGTTCTEPPRAETVEVGGACDVKMQPVAAVE
jgi:hypothetical protein